MTWTYNWNFSSQKDRIRREVSDTDSTNQLLADEEIAYAGTIEGSDVAVAARCCEWLFAKFAQKADITEGKLSLKHSQRAQFFMSKAKQLRALDSVGANPYIGGESISDKEATDEDTDRVPAGVWRYMLDNPQADEPNAESNDSQDD